MVVPSLRFDPLRKVTCVLYKVCGGEYISKEFEPTSGETYQVMYVPGMEIGIPQVYHINKDNFTKKTDLQEWKSV